MRRVPVTVESYSKTSVRPAIPLAGGLLKPAGASGNARTSSAASATGRPKSARARAGETGSGFSCANAAPHAAASNPSKLIVRVLATVVFRVTGFFVSEWATNYRTSRKNTEPLVVLTGTIT